MNKKLILIVATIFGLFIGIGALLKFQPGLTNTAALPTSKANKSGLELAKEQFLKIPLYFVENKGQADEQTDFLLQTKQGAAYFQADEVVLNIATVDKEVADSATNQTGAQAELASVNNEIKKELIGANEAAILMPEQELPGKHNYLIGNDESKWVKNAATYQQMRYVDVYPNIDLVYRGAANNELEYDFVVKPGGDPSDITFRYTGAAVDLAENGDLLVLKDGQELTREKSPVLYQIIEGKKVGVEGEFTITDQRVTFSVGEYDRNQELVIDPLVYVYATYYGYGYEQIAFTERDSIIVDTDAAGNIYLAGNIASPTPNYGDQNIVIVKLSSSGASLVYSTEIGGAYNTRSDFPAACRAGTLQGKFENRGFSWIIGVWPSSEPITTHTTRTITSSFRLNIAKRY